MQAGSTCREDCQGMTASYNATSELLAPTDALMLPGGGPPSTGLLPLEATQSLDFWAGW